MFPQTRHSVEAYLQIDLQCLKISHRPGHDLYGLRAQLQAGLETSVVAASEACLPLYPDGALVGSYAPPHLPVSSSEKATSAILPYFAPASWHVRSAPLHQASPKEQPTIMFQPGSQISPHRPSAFLWARVDRGLVSRLVFGWPCCWNEETGSPRGEWGKPRSEREEDCPGVEG